MNSERLPADVERILIAERSRDLLPDDERLRLAARIHAAAGAANKGRERRSFPRVLGLLLRPTFALAALVVCAGGAFAISGVLSRSPSPPIRPPEVVQRAGGRAAVADVPALASTGLRDEVALMSLARRALAAGDPKQASQLLGDHARRFPDGVLIEEREGLSAMVLWHAGDRPAARAAAARFRARYPQSALVRPLDELLRQTPL